MGRRGTLTPKTSIVIVSNSNSIHAQISFGEGGRGYRNIVILGDNLIVIMMMIMMMIIIIIIISNHIKYEI